MSEENAPEKSVSQTATETTEKKSSKHAGRNHNVTKGQLLWFHFVQGVFYLGMKLYFRMKYINSQNIPKSGATLVVSNHQSFLDPPAVVCGYYRPTSCLARKTLFDSKIFGKLIQSVFAIPLETNGLGYQGIKETLRRLKNQECVLIFPEGSRCYDGEIAEFTTGYVALGVKAKATFVPAAIAGAFEAYPRTKTLPSPFKPRVIVEYGEPIAPSDYANMTNDELGKMIEAKVHEIYERIRRKPKNSK